MFWYALEAQAREEEEEEEEDAYESRIGEGVLVSSKITTIVMLAI